MEMCKYKVCILVSSPEHQMLIVQTGFCAFNSAFLLGSRSVLEPTRRWQLFIIIRLLHTTGALLPEQRVEGRVA